ncbi:hypothetical protein [Streptomyces cavernae]|uniref:hypothetical protein n=1 Tax=Streptomyces cavernae TaxID=2259034 RepID=UPI000FEC05E9|nr:hypothetical protein [Streptomyces cavernae]
MKHVLELLGVLALIQGVVGLVHEFTGWRWGLIQRYGLFDGYELYVSITLVVLACALFMAADSRKSG